MRKLIILILILGLNSCGVFLHKERKSINVDSNPQGAEIYLNDTLVGVTPAKLDLRRYQNQLVLELKKENYVKDKLIIVSEDQHIQKYGDIVFGLLPYLLTASYDFDYGSYKIKDNFINLRGKDSIIQNGGSLEPIVIDNYYNLLRSNNEAMLQNLPKFNLNFELLGITRGLGGLNFEYSFLNFKNKLNFSLSTGIYLGAVSFANVNSLNVSYGSEYCIESSFNLINHLTVMSDNHTFEYCGYGTNRYRLGTTLGFKYNNLDNKTFYRIRVTAQWTDVECYRVEGNKIIPPILEKNVPLISFGFSVGTYF